MIPRFLSSPVTWACVALAAIVAVLIGLLLAPGNAPDDVEFIPATFTTYTSIPALLSAMLGGRPVPCNIQGGCVPAESPPFMVRVVGS